ncbi:hypothetical protein D3874_18130 [Oleomonas cavernae]|uniref:Uncharacterized protein n=1 Tax=Oleomonas cavernae TaxID=2320859 RepID=A0A418WF76_9PROT|nr:hypothetical protein [Oleomonas cavernae]RJF88671.1 hypothetical protein D3874_18130 [Oleomonas cavernae]
MAQEFRFMRHVVKAGARILQSIGFGLAGVGLYALAHTVLMPDLFILDKDFRRLVLAGVAITVAVIWFVGSGPHPSGLRGCIIGTIAGLAANLGATAVLILAEPSQVGGHLLAGLVVGTVISLFKTALLALPGTIFIGYAYAELLGWLSRRWSAGPQVRSLFDERQD